MNSYNGPVLRAKNISVEYRIQRHWRNVINDVDLEITPESIHGLVGESGSGKSTLGLALLQALPENGRIIRGELFFENRDMRSIEDTELRRLRSQGISFVPQNPMNSLNPSLQVIDQMTEFAALHQLSGGREAREHAEHWLEKVQIADPRKVSGSYPHQLSGGMLQRVLIAMALMHQPSLVILDEPTTALDVTTQATILDLLRDLIRTEKAAALYISHDLGTVAELCDQVSVMYAGELMESTSVGELFSNPRHPYTRGLLECLPGLSKSRRLNTIKGVAPALQNRSQACVFADRCPAAIDSCRKNKPGLDATPDRLRDGGHLVRCFRWKELEPFDPDAQSSSLHSGNSPQIAGDHQNGVENIPIPSGEKGRHRPLFQARNLATTFVRKPGLAALWGKRPEVLTAVDEVSLTVDPGRTLGVVGESGSGKTTLARTIVALQEADGGEMTLAGFSLSADLRRRHHQVLKGIRMVFQNPGDALNPFHSVGESLSRTYFKLGGVESNRRAERKHELDEKVKKMLTAVGLTADYARRYPHQLSGGEKQRVAIALAFAADSRIIIADEPTSSLDVSVQAVILNLLKELRETQRVSYIFISHDLEVIEYLADDIAVMYLGEILEQGSNAQVTNPPYHPYTEALLASAPRVRPEQRKKRIHLQGDIPSPRNKPGGCPFHTRCPHFIGNICVEQVPPAQSDGYGHNIRCHHPLDELRRLQGGQE